MSVFFNQILNGTLMHLFTNFQIDQRKKKLDRPNGHAVRRHTSAASMSRAVGRKPNNTQKRGMNFLMIFFSIQLYQWSLGLPKTGRGLSIPSQGSACIAYDRKAVIRYIKYPF
ncbi:unnamed protein product, partial [Meganyctiphanes norvegica]